MLKEERYDKILEIVETKNYVSTNELSKLLYVSLPTIRRDLAELHRRKLLLRHFGGAKKISSEHTVSPVDFRKSVNIAEKRKICKIAASYVGDSDIIFIDASTTAMQMAEFLSEKKQITVITNGLPLATRLVKAGIKTYATGGEMVENSLAYAGSFSEEFVRKFNIDTAFFSSYGVDSSGMIVDTSLPETQLRRTVINQAKKSIFLCDKSKFSLTAPYNLIHKDNVDVFITDDGA